MDKRGLAMPTVSSASVRDLLETCERLSLIEPSVLRDLNNQLPSLNDPALRIAEHDLIDLWQTIERKTMAKDAGLIIGMQINPATKGVLASWVSQCATINEALKVFLDNIVLMNPSERWTLEESNSRCILSFDIAAQKGYPIMAIERSMSAMVAWGRSLSGTSLPMQQASFSFSKPTYFPKYASIFGHDIAFNAPSNSVSFDSAILNQPVTSANPLLKSMIETKASALIRTLDTHRPVSSKVKQLIAASLPHKVPGTEQVSATMAMSRQTLYRRLKQEGTDYKTLLDEVRKEKAAQLLKQGNENILSIGLSLGFKEPSSFYKAFKRWYGVSVKEYLAEF
jgi:AraC-like DNA-binding protein